MTRSIHKKLTYEDKFARKYYPDHARLNLLRSEKREQHRQMRRLSKKVIREGLEEVHHDR